MKHHSNRMSLFIIMEIWIGSRLLFISPVVILMSNFFHLVKRAIVCRLRDVDVWCLDEQDCELRFGSWTYDQHQLNFTYYNEIERHVTIKDYVVSGSWDLMDGPMTIHHPSNTTRNSIEKSYRSDRVEFVCKLSIRRKTLFYTVNLIIPTVMSKFIEIKAVMLVCLHLGAHLVFINLCFLSSNGCWWKNDLINIDSSSISCVSLTNIENFTTYINSYTVNCQISSIYVYYEYNNNLLYGRHY